MTDAPARRPRGSFALYGVAFALVLLAGAMLVWAAKEFLSSTRLLWVSTILSAAAIVVAIAGTLVPRRR